MKLGQELHDFGLAKCAATLDLVVGSLVGCGESQVFMAARGAGYAPAAPADAFPRATWFGVTTLLFDDGQTQVLIDGFFSRPEGSLLSRVSPDPRLAEEGVVAAYGIKPAVCRLRGMPLLACPFEDRTGLSLIIPAHAHFDHVLDSPLIAGLTGAMLLEAASVKPISRATKNLFGENIGPIDALPRVEVARLHSSEGLKVGTMTLRLIETPHIHTPASLLTNGATSNDFAFPAWKWEMHEGENYAVWIEAASHSILVIPSGGDIMEQLNAEGIQADTVFLGVGYTGRLNEQEWDQLWERP